MVHVVHEVHEDDPGHVAPKKTHVRYYDYQYDHEKEQEVAQSVPQACKTCPWG